MELLLPQGFLLIWYSVFIVTICLFIASVILLVLDKSKKATDKILWFLLILHTPIIGPLIYILGGRKRKKESEYLN
jgi:hypothetical protein